MLTDGVARVMTVSWGCAEFGTCATDDLMDTQDAIFSAMSGQGWTLIADANDKGPVADCARLSVEFPASDPNIVAAGTELDLNPLDGSFAGEVAWTGGTFPGACAENHGGGGGGNSFKFEVPFWQSFLGNVVRTLPDISLNAAIPQTIFFNGAVSQAGGTSIVAPELAGFFAQENGYLGFLQSLGLPCFGGSQVCAPIGNPNPSLYEEMEFGLLLASHYPYYDTTVGCATNDITINNHLIPAWCAVTGYDLATGLGSVNMLQLAWALNWFAVGDFAPPEVSFSGPAINAWYNTDQQVNMFFFDASSTTQPPSGIAGFSVAWDVDPDPESFFKNTPGTGDAFYDGPEFPNQDKAALILSQAGQGCHTAMARAWDNTGTASGLLSYGPICYDTVVPVTTATLTGPTSGGVFTSGATVTLSAKDTGSGLAGTFYSFDGVNYTTYTGPFTVSAPGTYTLRYYSKDIAGNTETVHSTAFVVGSPVISTVTTVTSSLNPSTSGVSVTFTAKVTPSSGATPTGNVTFKDGSTTLGTAALSAGKTTFATMALSVGTHVITAAYAGNSTDAGSTSAALTQTVNNGGSSATSTNLASSRNPAPHGKSVTFTATVTPASGGPVSGTVTFKDGAATLVVLNVSASTHQSSYATNALTKGTHSITAVYSGNTTLKGSTSAVLKQVVN